MSPLRNEKLRRWCPHGAQIPSLEGDAGLDGPEWPALGRGLSLTVPGEGACFCDLSTLSLRWMPATPDFQLNAQRPQLQPGGGREAALCPLHASPPQASAPAPWFPAAPPLSVPTGLCTA